MLSRLGTDHADVVFVQNVDEPPDYETVVAAGGLLELAQRLRDDGKTRFIGMSGHSVPMSMRAVHSGRFDVLMFPINPAADALPGEATLDALYQAPEQESPASLPHGKLPSRRALYHVCARENVGLVGMKPFAGGRLLHSHGPDQPALTPVQCLSYALSQAGISTVLPGVRTTDELEAVLQFHDATDRQRDFGAAVAAASWSYRGSCVYCNHCLPCPSKIDVARTLRLADSAQQGVSDDLRAAYRALPAPASDCTECGQCVERCPFGVDVIEKMRRAVELLEATG
jgi:predicted aldo/keto reductase-like oxidoreductase